MTASPAITPPIEIFAAGSHTSQSGEALSFSPADLVAMAAAYDPALSRAPLVVGHPATDDPAYGWVLRLAVRDGTLIANPYQVDPDFAELVNAGRYGAISAAFYRPGAVGNPVPGVWYLRHVGFLGAQPPAVKGLKPPQFAAADAAEIVLFSSSPATSSAGAPATSFAGAQPPQEHRVTATPITSADAEAALAADRAKLAADRIELDRQLASFAEQRAAVRLADDKSFIDGLVKSGRLPSELAGSAVQFMSLMDATQVVQFAEAGAVVSKTAHQAFRDLVGALPPMVQFGEVAGAGAVQALGAGYASPPGTVVDKDRLALHTKAVAFAAANKVDYIDAVKAVSGGRA